jgi:alpha/beta hydrolase fold
LKRVSQPLSKLRMQHILTNRVLIILAGVCVLASCTSLSEEFAKKATELKLNREVVTGTRFQHVIYSNTGHSSMTLHIYLDGDGTPWIAGRPSDDPTPLNPMVLKLMALDKAPAVYVGRPCYHGVMTIGACSSQFWLKDRYSEEVVVSLATVIKQLLEQGGYENIAWFGHSGGGALAVLLATRFPQTVSIVTVAANLDLAAWATYTEHNDLSGSLNPASLPPLPPLIQQRHYAGSKDRIVPPALMAKAAAHLGSKLIVFENYDHVCCWEQIWPTVLNELAE